MNTYIAELRNAQGGFVSRMLIEAPHRAKAVHQAQLWYWTQYKGSLRPVHKVMTVSDPEREVRYSESFNCADKTNRLLPESVLTRVIAESNGELTCETGGGTRNHAPGSVRRVKRRRDFGKFIAPNIRRMKRGILYYRIVRVPQKSSRGKIVQKRRYIDVRLAARTLPDAITEIQSRRLKHEHDMKSARIVKARSLKLTSHVIGLQELSHDDRIYFAHELSRYEKVTRSALSPQ